MRSQHSGSAPHRQDWLSPVFAFCFGSFFALCILKFSNPAIMEKYVTAPSNFLEVIFGSPWPIAWAYYVFLPVLVLGIATARRSFIASVRLDNRRPSRGSGWEGRGLLLSSLPLLWLIWQAIAATCSVALSLSGATLEHFAVVVACFYLGLFALNATSWFFWSPIIVAFFLSLWSGWEQHFGGLEETRRYFFAYIYPTLKEAQPEYLKKMSSNRIFGTFFYPNALAGALLLFLPPLLGVIAQARRLFTPAARHFLCVITAIASVGCLYWSGSKGGWLLMLLLGLIGLLRLDFPRSLKRAMVAAILVAGLTGFFVKYAAFFHRGATSVVARFDYWRAALVTTAANPVVGTGPGTFSIAYAKLKRPEAEMARLAHNDYLQQATDSGLPGFLLYGGFIAGALICTCPFRKAAPQVTALDLEPKGGKLGSGPGAEEKNIASCQPRPTGRAEFLFFPLWLGVLGWALQGFVEFGLYLPNLAWPAFAFLGCLVDLANSPNTVDIPATHR